MNPNSRYEATLTLSSFNGSDDGPVSFARVGLHVFPELYHDTELRLYTSWRDPTTQLWTVYREEYYNTSLKIGWWQKGILGGLEDKADAVQWISYAYYLDNNTGPSMGSGHFPREGSHKAAYMADLKHFDQAGNVYSPNIHDLARHVDRPDCYDVLPAAAFLRELSDIHKFYYGGPRGCRN
ncbi:hypothetical protein LUZ62_018959 [Rhynchospora pubera]|uniref:Neprosin PEP catalytic domain-containing protein n=1 Tax=Rhynchospora pubera TaxID=906938 RepID=A0AAV8GTN7_9POAL|nr:hypothetical protein LUZ62_018959 [Rhynchospora pubera]